jgi:AcrR family transcriptional regulator
MLQRMHQKDGETRSRVLEAATRLFAADGFKKVTVREICREAGANVAAVNYHFGDKLGLYEEVMAQAMETMRETTAIAQREGEGRPADEKLAAFVGVIVDRVIRHAKDSWIHRLMTHEMTDPTPVLSVIQERVITPRMNYVAELIAEMLGVPASDPRVLRCCMSVLSPLYFATAKMDSAVFPLVTDDEGLAALREHMTAFSLAGIRAVK